MPRVYGFRFADYRPNSCDNSSDDVALPIPAQQLVINTARLIAEGMLAILQTRRHVLLTLYRIQIEDSNCYSCGSPVL